MIRRSKKDSSRYQDILFAVLGISPAVLTETIWGLAMEDPPVIPSRIFVLTTVLGRKALREALFMNGGWHRLVQSLEMRNLPVDNRLHFGLSADHVRLFPKPDGHGDLRDIVTEEDSRHAADYMMRCLREFTDDAETRIIASIAGGRKTMGALLTSCMTLLGRTQDRLCHVLVAPPYDSALLDPPFLFPEHKMQHTIIGSDQTIASVDARIELTDIPFVRVRTWYEKEHGHALPSYMSLVRMVKGLSPQLQDLPQVIVDTKHGFLSIGEVEVQLANVEFGFFYILARRLREKRFLASWTDLDEDILRLKASRDSSLYGAWFHDFVEKKYESKEDPRKLASSIRKKIGLQIRNKQIADLLIPSLKAGNRELYPSNRINFKKS